VLAHGENCDNSDTDNEDSDSEQDETGAIRNGYRFVVRGDFSLPHAMAIVVAETSEATSKLMRCDGKRFLVDLLCFESEIELWDAAGTEAAQYDLSNCCVREMRWAAVDRSADENAERRRGQNKHLSFPAPPTSVPTELEVSEDHASLLRRYDWRWYNNKYYCKKKKKREWLTFYSWLHPSQFFCHKKATLTPLTVARERASRRQSPP
jgi:hypothetical protein